MTSDAIEMRNAGAGAAVPGYAGMLKGERGDVLIYVKW